MSGIAIGCIVALSLSNLALLWLFWWTRGIRRTYLAKLIAINEALPATYYGGQSLPRRVQMMVQHWRRLVELTNRPDLKSDTTTTPEERYQKAYDEMSDDLVKWMLDNSGKQINGTRINAFVASCDRVLLTLVLRSAVKWGWRAACATYKVGTEFGVSPLEGEDLHKRAVAVMESKTITATQLRAAVDGFTHGYQERVNATT